MLNLSDLVSCGFTTWYCSAFCFILYSIFILYIIYIQYNIIIYFFLFFPLNDFLHIVYMIKINRKRNRKAHSYLSRSDPSVDCMAAESGTIACQNKPVGRGKKTVLIWQIIYNLKAGFWGYYQVLGISLTFSLHIWSLSPYIHIHIYISEAEQEKGKHEISDARCHKWDLWSQWNLGLNINTVNPSHLFKRAEQISQTNINARAPPAVW